MLKRRARTKAGGVVQGQVVHDYGRTHDCWTMLQRRARTKAGGVVQGQVVHDSSRTHDCWTMLKRRARTKAGGVVQGQVVHDSGSKEGPLEKVFLGPFLERPSVLLARLKQALYTKGCNKQVT